MGLRTPDRVFDRISHIDIVNDLLRQGLTGALLDVDNTIRSRADGRVPPDVRAWLQQAQEAGVQLCILSNNWHEDVPRLAAELGLPYVHKAVKPLPFGYRAALRKIARSCDQTVMIGDQLYTDIVGAHAAGMQAYLVGPLSSADLWYAKALRRIAHPARPEKAGRNHAPETEPAFMASAGRARSINRQDDLDGENSRR